MKCNYIHILKFYCIPVVWCILCIILKILFKSNKYLFCYHLFSYFESHESTNNRKRIPIPTKLFLRFLFQWTGYHQSFRNMKKFFIEPRIICQLFNPFFRMRKRLLYLLFYFYYEIWDRDSEKNLKYQNSNQKNKSCFLIISDWLEPIQIKWIRWNKEKNVDAMLCTFHI